MAASAPARRCDGRARADRRSPSRGRWRLDAEHNPDPLSTAQASLVAFADALAVGARLRVVERYLYVGDVDRVAHGGADSARPAAPLFRRRGRARLQPRARRRRRRRLARRRARRIRARLPVVTTGKCRRRWRARASCWRVSVTTCSLRAPAAQRSRAINCCGSSARGAGRRSKSTRRASEITPRRGTSRSRPIARRRIACARWRRQMAAQPISPRARQAQAARADAAAQRADAAATPHRARCSDCRGRRFACSCARKRRFGARCSRSARATKCSRPRSTKPGPATSRAPPQRRA